MTRTNKPRAERANASDDVEGERRGRGPGIARETPRGRPTAYAVKKEIWSSRGELRAKGLPKKFGIDDGIIVKSQAVRVLSELDNEAAAPFVLKGKTLVPISGKSA
jgi:hypothetical protein